MKQFKLTLVTAMLLSVFITGCNEDTEYVHDVTTYNAYISEGNYTHQNDPSIKLTNLKSINVMTYNMPNVKNQLSKVTALVMYPKAPKPKDGWRIVVWDHGTEGVGDACAPSNMALRPNFQILAESLLNAGYVIVAPDYEGLGTPGIHPYLHIKSEAYAAIYAVNAIQEKYKSDFNGQWMTAGQSQGGQASLAAAEFANNDLNYKGAVVAAPGSTFREIVLNASPAKFEALEQDEIANNVAIENRKSVVAKANLLTFTAFAAVGVKSYDSQFDYNELFQERARKLATSAEGTTGENGLCWAGLAQKFKDDIILFLNENKDKTLKDYPGIDDEKFKNNYVFQKFIDDNQPGTRRINTPVLVIQGTEDSIIPFKVTEKLVEQISATGTNVTFLPVEGAEHTQAIVQKNDDVVAFIKAHMPAN